MAEIKHLQIGYKLLWNKKIGTDEALCEKTCLLALRSGPTEAGL